jgi:hypothetical protein
MFTIFLQGTHASVTEAVLRKKTGKQPKCGIPSILELQILHCLEVAFHKPAV